MKKILFVLGFILLFGLVIVLLGAFGGSDDESLSTTTTQQTTEKQQKQTEETTSEITTVEDTGEIITEDAEQFMIDYEDADTFEKALNDGKDVKNKVVKFVVSEYHPDSIAGYNAWAGEHLNFISGEDLKLSSKDVVVCRVLSTDKSWGSWYIDYEVVEIIKAEAEITTQETTEQVEVTTTEVEEIQSQYEKAFVRELSGYTLYYMFDEDTKEVISFGTNDTYVMKGVYTGEFSKGLDINWVNDGWHETFTYVEGNDIAILIDGNGYEWEYEVFKVGEAQSVLDGLK